MSVGNLTLARQLQAQVIKPKLRVSQPGDADELEADRLADHAMSGEHKECSCGGTCASCQAATLRRSSRSGIPSPPSTNETIRRSLGAGRPLDAGIRSDMEQRLDAGFEGVRVHTGPQAARAAQSVNARAFTLGTTIAFDEGEYAPDTTQGQRLLAHELAHVRQASNEGPATLRRQAADAGVPDAGYVDAGGNTSNTMVFRGEVVSDDPAYTYKLLERIYIANGYGAVEAFVNGFDYEYVLPGRPAGGINEDPVFQRNSAINSTLREQFERIKEEERIFLSTFLDRARTAGHHALEESSQHVEAEAIRYGVRNIHDVPSFWWGMLAPDKKGEMADNASTRGIAIAAQGMLDRKRSSDKAVEAYREATSGQYQIAELAEERARQGQGFTLEKSRFETMRERIELTKRELDVYRVQIQIRYPLLAALSVDEDFRYGALEDLAKAEHGQAAAATKVIVDQIVEKRESIKKVREELKEGGDINIWRVPKLLQAARAELKIEPGTLQDRMVNDKIEYEKPGWLTGVLIGLLQLGLVLLAPFTGGATLIPAAGIAVGSAYSHYKEYELKAALHNTDFGAAALSAEEPSLFWLAVDIIGAGFDLLGAGGAAVKIFRRLAPAAKAVREAEAGAEAIVRLEREAAEIGGKKLAQQVAKDAAAIQKGTREVGITADEAQKLAAAGEKVAAEQIGEGVHRAITIAGGEVKVTRTGTIWSCQSPCAMMRERYRALLAREKEYLSRLDDLEERARKLAPDDNLGRQKVADEAAALERTMRTKSLPGDWTSPRINDPEYADLVRQRGSVAAQLDHHPPGWSGKQEASFRYGDLAEAEPGYRWVLDENGLLRYERMRDTLPHRQFNPATLEFEEAVEAGFIRAVKGAEEAKPLASLPASEQKAMNKAFEQRRKLIVERDRLEAAGKLSPADSKRLDRLHWEINEESRRLGEHAAEGVMQGRGGKRIYPRTQTHSKPGDFDQVWQVGDEFHIVEAKGGSSGLGSRMVGEGVRAEQGTLEYAKSIAENMATNGATKEVRKLGNDLIKALGQGKVKYVLVRAPIQKTGGVVAVGEIRVSEFVLPPLASK